MGKKIVTLKALEKIANELDFLGFTKEANAITGVMIRVALASVPYEGTNITGNATENAFYEAGNAVSKLIEACQSADESIANGFMSVANIAVATSPFFMAIDAVTGYLADSKNEAVAPYISTILELKRKLAQSAASKSTPAVLTVIGAIKSAAQTILSEIQKRKDLGQYSATTDEFQDTIDYAVKNKLTVRQMYDYAVTNRGGGAYAGNYANNLIAKYRTIHPDPDTALVKPTKYS